MRRRLLFAVGGAVIALLLVAALAAYFASRSPRRRRSVPISRQTAKKTASKEISLPALPIEKWTERLVTLQRSGRWDDLDSDLDEVSRTRPADYARLHLDYLHARVKIETNDLAEAAERFQHFAAAGNNFRDLALAHLSEIAEAQEDGASAARYRLQLIREYPGSSSRDEAIEDQLSWLDEHGSAAEMSAFRNELYPAASSALRRELDSRAIAGQLRATVTAPLIAQALGLIRAGSGDDPADRVFIALDRPEIIRQLPVDALLTLGETAKEHRHFDRSVELLRAARAHLPAQKQDDVSFSIGRSLFGAERYAEAEATYLSAANQSRDPKMKSTLLFHASRAAQLRGDDVAAERSMTAALAVPGKFPATSAALTQRMRTRLHASRWAEANQDLAQVRRLFPKDHAVVEATLSHALYLIAAGRNGEADAELASIDPHLLAKFESSELAYWRGRATEKANPALALKHYLEVLRSSEPTHFAYFARQRLVQPPLRPEVDREVATLKGAVAAAIARKDYEGARKGQTELVLLRPDDASLAELRRIYTELPRYRAIAELEPSPFPSFRSTGPALTRGETLMMLGLFDEAEGEIIRRYPLHPAPAGLAQSLALNQAGASKESILAIEILMKSVPSDFIPELMPRLLLELLYPRYFYDSIEHDSDRFKADPRLVVSIMREESRFNPRAKSVAAARGLLQFIITTARDVGRAVGMVKLAPNDLYDPRTIIELGAKYIADLLTEFHRNPYQAAAAYNAGPNQTRLWNRLAPAPGDDFFLSSINFDETKHYVRKVLNSYWRYGEIYEGANPAAGLRPEP